MKKLDMKWLVVVTFVIAGALCGAAIGSYMVTMDETLGEDIGVWNELMKFLELILLMYIVYMVNVIIHEGGHLIFGLMTGYKFNSFRIFSVILIKQNGKLKIKNISLAGTGGQCLMSPPELIDGKMPYVLYNLGGVILNVITSLIFIVIYLISLWKLLSLAMIMSAIMGFASALVNGIPMKVGDINNDGYNAVQLGRDKDALKALWVQLKMNGALAEGIGIREMPEEWFESIDGKNDNPMITSIKVFYCNRLMEMHKFEQTKEEIKKMYTAVSRLLKLSLECFMEQDGVNKPEEKLAEIAILEASIDKMERRYQKHHIKRLAKGDCEPRAGLLFSDMLSELERIADHSVNIAYSMSDEDEDEMLAAENEALTAKN